MSSLAEGRGFSGAGEGLFRGDSRQELLGEGLREKEESLIGGDPRQLCLFQMLPKAGHMSSRRKKLSFINLVDPSSHESELSLVLFIA